MEALVGLAGVIIGAMIAPTIDWLRRRRERHSRARYLAIRTVIALNRYVAACAEAIEDDPLPSDEASFETPNHPDLPSDVDWSAIKPELAYNLLSLPNRHEDAQKAVSSLFHFTLDSWGARDERDERFVELGLAASELSTELRTRYRLDAPPSLKWDPVERLTEKNAEIERQAREVQARRARREEDAS